MGLIPGSGRSIGEGNGNPLQHSFLGNPMERGAWRATLYRVTKSWTQLKRLSAHTHTHTAHQNENVSDSRTMFPLPQSSFSLGREQK